jgi:hypothetical protein
VRVIVTSAGDSQTLSPSPGESSSMVATEGVYTASVIPDQEWLDYAKATRKFLNDQLANSDHLTGPQLLDVVQRLKNVAVQMKQFQDAAGSAGSCSGNVTSNSDGLVSVTTSASGALAAVCK